MIIGALQISKSYQQNCFILGKILPRNSRDSSKFQITSTKLVYYWEKFYLVIITVQIFKWHHQNCFFCEKLQLVIVGAGQTFEWHHQNVLIFAKISALDNRASSKVQVTSSKLSFWAKISARNSRGNSSIQFSRNDLFLRKFQLVIIGVVQIFKSLHWVLGIFAKTSTRDYRDSLNFQMNV